MNLDALLSRFDAAPDGDGWIAACPAHADSHPSLRISVGERAVVLKCRAGCETSAVLGAVGLSFSDLPRPEGIPASVPRARGTEEPLGAADRAALAVRLDGYAAALREDPDAILRAWPYAERRFGLVGDAVFRLGLGYADDLGGGGRLVVPFRDERGVPLGFQARALSEDAAVRWLGPRNPATGSWTKVAFFPGATGWDEVIVCEGPGDALTACGVGYDSIGVRGAGLASNPAVVADLVRMIGDRPVVVFGDADASGERFARTLVAALSAAGVSVVVAATPDGNDVTAWREADPDGFATAFVRRVKEALASAPSAIAARLNAFTDVDLTDLGMAKRLRERIESTGSGVKYAPEVGFFLLRSGVWRPDLLDEVRTAAQASAEAIWREAEALEVEVDALDPDSAEGRRERKRLNRLRAFAKHANSTRGLDSMIRELSALPGIASDVNAFDAHPDLLAVRNGVVNLRTGELQPHDPALLLTRRVDIDYDATAQAPRWERFLEEVFSKHPDLPAYMRRLVGYGVTGLTTEQCFAVLHGTGANGKSVFTDTLTEVFREVTTTTPFQTFEERGSGGIPNDLAALKGARLVMASEGEQGRPMAEAVLKRVTGRDLIAARYLRKEFFEFRPTFLLLLATNFRPQFRGQDEGLWRRVKLIPWDRYFAPSERDHRLGEQLLAERAGILAWAVRGAVEWYAGGLQDPPVVRDATREYRETSDALAGFLGKALDATGFVVTGSDSDAILGSALWTAYQGWADEEALPARERWTRRTFFAALEERGLRKVKRSAGTTFLGVRRHRATDAVPHHDEPERAEESAVALSSPVIAHGPSLDEVF